MSGVFQVLLDVLQNANFQWVLLGTSLLGVAGGLLSVFTVLRQQSLIGDVMSHAALPGICLSYLLFGVKSIPVFLGGAIVSGLLAGLMIQWIVQSSRLRYDAALAIVLSVFFAAGIVLLSYIQRIPIGNQAGIDRFLFGQAAALIASDIWLIASCALFILAIVLCLFKEFRLICFNSEFAASVGIPVRSLHLLLTLMIASVVMIGIQIVGVVLMVALLITPALAARYWTDRFGWMLVISAVIGGVSGTVGTLAGTWLGDLPTGPSIILTAAILFLLSALFAPRKGLLARRFRT